VLSFLLTSDILEPLPLAVAPVGWANLRYLFARGEYHGVTLSMSSELTFWKQGGAYLRVLYEGGVDTRGRLIAAQGIEAVAVLTVFETDPNEFRTVPVYRARIDFTTYRPSEAGVQVKLKELGFATSLLARADTEVDLFGNTSLGGVALPAPAPANILLHSQMLRLKYVATQKADADLSPGLMFGNDGDLSHEQILYFGFDTQGDNDLGLEPVGGGFVAADQSGADSAAPIYTAKENGPFTINLRLLAHVEAHTQKIGLLTRQFQQVDCKYHLRVAGSITETIELAPTSSVGGLDGDFEEDINIRPFTRTWDLKIGDRIYLYADYYVHKLNATNLDPYQATLTATMKEGSYFKITAESTTPATAARGLLVHEALQRTVEAMTDQAGGLYSEYFGRTDCYPSYALDGPGSLRFLTNGFGLRDFPLPTDTVVPNADGTDPRKPLTGSFSAIYGGLDAIDCLGAGFEQRAGRPMLRVEPRSFFYQPTETLRLGAVQGLVGASPDLAGFYNEVHVGYNHWQSGAAVGLDEFNGQRTYTLPLSQVKATYTALCGLNAAGYLIEQARRQPFVMGTNQEGQADQELFVICLRRDPLTQSLSTQRAEGFSMVSGILDKDTAYNLPISPKRNLYRHGAFIRVGLAPQAAQGKKLTLGVVEGNDKLVSQLISETIPVDEHADVPLTDLATPAYLSETYEFTAKLRRHQVKQLAAKPYGLISFLDAQGNRKRGYLKQVECEPESGKASFTLLRATS
jgi:hypothetical protein